MAGFFVMMILIVMCIVCKCRKRVTRVNPQNQHKGVLSVMGNVNLLSLVSQNNSARAFTSSPIYTQPTFSAQMGPTYTPPPPIFTSPYTNQQPHFGHAPPPSAQFNPYQSHSVNNSLNLPPGFEAARPY